MLEILTTGKLVGQPEQRTAKSGKTYATAKLRVAAGAEEVLFVRLTAFSDTACTALLALADGDALAVAGTLKIGVWTPQGGEPRPNLDLVVAQVLSVYHLERRRKAMQPGGDKGPATPATKPARRQAPAQRCHYDFGDAGDAWLRGAP